MSRRFAAILAAALVAALPAAAADLAPGTRLRVDAAALPAPGATPSVGNPPQVVAREGRMPSVPAGFTVTVFADSLTHARWLAVAENGDVFLAEPRAGHVLRLVDKDGDGRAERRDVVVSGLSHPHGLAVRPGALYVADLERVWRIALDPNGMAGAPQPVTPPGALGDAGGHWTRNIVFHPGGDRFYVAIGSRGNVGEEPEPRATIREFAADGSGGRSFAGGLRNPVGIAFRPGSDELWTVVNERDGLGDELVPDYLTRVQDGGFYGWPYSYLGAHPQPGLASRRPDLVKRAIVPDVLFRSHSAPLGLVFYQGSAFPADMQDDAFVALHGSWNAAEPRGYAVVRVPFTRGRPEGGYEVFASGFWIKGEDRARVWGRPAGLAVARDGSLLVADDVAQVVWRIAARH